MHEPVAAEYRPVKSRRRRHGRVLRFVRGYLMIVGGLTTGYVLLQLVIWLLVEAGRIM